jgi:hypothetical protein
MRKIFLIITVVIGVSAISCGSEKKNTCDQANEIKLSWCAEYESDGCLPCVCLSRGQDYNMVWRPPPFDLQLDIWASDCIPQKTCEGQTLEDAKLCIEDHTTCDPCIHQKQGVVEEV